MSARVTLVVAPALGFSFRDGELDSWLGAELACAELDVETGERAEHPGRVCEVQAARSLNGLTELGILTVELA
jgi:hypothetical protein